MRASHRRLPELSLRRFWTSTFIITLLTAYAIFLRPTDSDLENGAPLALQPRLVDEDCRLVHRAEDQCAFILKNCMDDEAGLIPYLSFYYCTLGSAQPVAFIVLVVWLGLLFTSIGIAASDFFSVNLSTIASILGLSESLAGVTFLAFGNGSPDVFSTFAAMGSNSGSMAVGELIGAAGFITAVVAGSMALVREFKVSKKTFVRDICFFIVAVSFAMVFLADGQLNLWECICMIGFYVFYVIVVVGWHWFSTRRRRKRAKEAASRGHFSGTVGDATDELEPYHDEADEDDDAAPLDQPRRAATEDLSLLERGTPRIDISEVEGPEEDEEEERGRHLTAEMTSSMRVNRPRGRRRNTTITPIRPSLVGVLEFRSILSTLQKSGNVHLAPLQRRYTDHPTTLAEEQSSLSLNALHPGTIQGAPSLQPGASGRDRALSHGDIPLNLENADLPTPTIVAEAPQDDGIPADAPDTGDRPLSLPIPTGNIAPPLAPASPSLGSESGPSADAPKSPVLQLQIPGPHSHGQSNHSSPLASPFPGYLESPLPMTTPPLQQPPSRVTTFSLSGPDRDVPYPGIEDDELPKPVRWWPYRFLPPPHVLMCTLFPTLQGWSDKNIWDKLVSVISVPSIFLLVTTLPVVDTESKEDDESEDTLVDGPPPGSPGHTAPPVSVEPRASIQPETEWQRYRRSTRSQSRLHSYDSSPALTAVDGSGHGRRQVSEPQPMSPVHPAPGLVPDHPTPRNDEPDGWNRWLVSLQLFTGPLFTVFVIWANMEESGKMLVRLVLYSLLGSLLLLAVLLVTTTPDKRPKYHFLLCFLGFIIAIAWISTVAGEVVGVLKAFGIIIGISEAILGLTIFAVGNSVGDLVADITVARLGYPVMALSACFGGPMLNILLGVGIGGAWMTTKTANHKHEKHPDKPLHYKPYHIDVGGTLMVSAITVLITLIFLLIAVPANNWIMSRKIGFSLIGIWAVSTVVNVGVEVGGVWKDVA